MPLPPHRPRSDEGRGVKPGTAPEPDSDYLKRFPGRQEIATALEANERWRKRLEVWLVMFPHDRRLGEAMCEAKAAGSAWFKLEVLSDPRSYSGYVREDLLRALGPEAFYAGRMPEPVPARYVAERD